MGWNSVEEVVEFSSGVEHRKDRRWQNIVAYVLNLDIIIINFI